MTDLFVEPTKDLIKIVNKAILKAGNSCDLARGLKICRVTLYHWLIKRCWINVAKFKKICKFLEIDWFTLLEGKKIRNRKTGPERFSKRWFKLNPNRSRFLGWICTEGYIPKNCCRIAIPQKDYQTLKRLKELVKKEYPISTNPRIRNREKIYTLEINSPLLWYVLVNHFKIPYGNKAKIISVPKKIFDSDAECKWAFLASSFEGDGSWPPSWLSLRMISENYIKGCQRLFKDLGYKLHAAPLSQKNLWLLQCCAKKDMIEIIYKFIPYLIYEEKFNRFLNKDSFRDKFYKNLSVDFDNKKIIEIKNQIKCTYKGMSLKIHEFGGKKYSESYIINLANKGFKRGVARMKLPSLVSLSKLSEQNLVPEKFKWVVNAIRLPSLTSLQNGY